MITLSQYVKTVLERKKWNQARFLKELNTLENKYGLKHTRKQNISNYLHDDHGIDRRTLAKWEVALGLPDDSLISFAPPEAKETENRMKEYRNMLRGKK